MFKRIQKIDDKFLGWLQKHQHFTLDYFCRDLSSLGGSTIIPLVVGFSSVILWVSGQSQQAIINILSCIVVTLIISGLKELIKRPGPIEYDPFRTGMSLKVHHFPAFPSGHTCLSTYTFLSLGILAGHAFPDLKIFFISSALSLGAVIGFCKCYLYAHWLSDTIVGYGLALLFTFIWSLL